MEVLRIAVPCVCAPDGRQHHVELGLTEAPHLPVNSIRQPAVQILSMRTPCDHHRAEVDAVERLGGVTCLGMFADLRELLRAGTSFMTDDKLVSQVAAAIRGPIDADPFEDNPNPLDVTAAVRSAARLRNERGVARLRAITEADAAAAGWLPGHIRLMITEALFAERLRRCWPGNAPPSDIRLNLRIPCPQVQISWGMIEKQPVYEFVSGKRWQPTDSSPYDVLGPATLVLLHELLPVRVMRGVLRARTRT